jgi:hypothetical protein
MENENLVGWMEYGMVAIKVSNLPRPLNIKYESVSENNGARGRPSRG